MVWLGFYLILVSLAAWLAYGAFHQRWLRRERARTVVGVLVVFLPALPLVLAGLANAVTYLALFCGFGVAGAVTLFRDIQAETEGSNDIREEILSQ